MFVKQSQEGQEPDLNTMLAFIFFDKRTSSNEIKTVY
jgi:hypothetical protein